MNNIVKNQHIIPRVHLKKFCDTNGKLKTLNADSLSLEKDQSPTQVCKGFFHYALNEGIEDEYSQIIEKNFGSLEDWYGKNIPRIEENIIVNKELSEEDKFGLSWIVVNFYFRGYSFRKETTKSIRKINEWVEPSLTNMFNKKHNDLNENDVRGVVNDQLKQYEKNTSYSTARSFDVGFVNTLTHKKWNILINNSKTPFITGDEAVLNVFDDNIKKNQLSGSFLLMKQIINLSPKVSIVISFYMDDEEHGKIYFTDITDNIKKVYEQNLLYINYTHKYCYSSDNMFFENIIKFEKNK